MSHCLNSMYANQGFGAKVNKSLQYAYYYTRKFKSRNRICNESEDKRCIINLFL